MEIQITAGDRVLDFNQRFEELFPYLKIEFTSMDENHHHSNGVRTPLRFMPVNQQTQGVQLRITADTKFSDLSADFASIFGLKARLFRKAADSWLETTNTQTWTLKDQNSQGQRISTLLGEIKEDRP